MKIHIAFFLILINSICISQNELKNCLISGYIVDKQGLPIVNATVVLFNHETKDTSYTNEIGKYCLNGFYSGYYNLKAKHSSFGTYNLNGLIIKHNNGFELDTITLSNTHIQLERITIEANKYFQEKDYLKASKLYQIVLVNSPGDTSIINKLNEIEKIQSFYICYTNLYPKIIAKANELYESKEYYNSCILFERAAKLKPSDNYPQEMVLKINNILLKNE